MASNFYSLLTNEVIKMNDMQNFNNFSVLKMFNLQESDIEHFHIHLIDNVLNIDVTLFRKDELCPHCGHDIYRVKGYVPKKLVHAGFTNQKCVINYKARRYHCSLCSKTFYEHNPFAFDGMRFTMSTVYNVLKDLKSVNETFTSVASRHNLSTTTVTSIFDNYVDISRGKLSKVMCIDEVYAFKSYRGKYVCVLLDFKTQEIIDLLPSRKKYDLYNYFETIPKEERDRVKVVSIDMWHTYKVVVEKYFKNAVCAVDKFHILQEFTRRFTYVRIQEMNRYRDEPKKTRLEMTQLEIEAQYRRETNYTLLKKFNWLLSKRNKVYLEPNSPRKYNRILKGHYNYYEIREKLFMANPKLREAHKLQSLLYRLYELDYEEAEPVLIKLIEQFKQSSIKEMNNFANTLMTWKKEIINSFIEVDAIRLNDQGEKELIQTIVTNATIENKNKSIKTLKRNANGFKNWKRFRNRILYSVNQNSVHYLYPIKAKEKKS